MVNCKTPQPFLRGGPLLALLQPAENAIWFIRPFLGGQPHFYCCLVLFSLFIVLKWPDTRRIRLNSNVWARPIKTAEGRIHPGHSEYWFLSAYWITQFPGQFYQLSEAELRDDPEVRSILRQFPIEFYAAMDLALWPPFGPSGFVGDHLV